MRPYAALHSLPMSSKPLGEFLQQADGAGALMAQARQLLVLRRATTTLLPAPLRKLYQVANYKQGTLIVFAANNAVAAKLRLMRPALLQACLESGTAVRELKIEVEPAAFVTPHGPKKRAFLSGGARLALERLEAQLSEGALRERIRALAKKS